MTPDMLILMRAQATSVMNRFARHALVVLFAGLAIQLASCGRGDPRRVYPTTGKLFFKGKPADGARITLVDLDGKDPKMPRPGAYVKKDGSFRLSTYRSYDGAPAGRYAVTVVYRSPARKVEDENAGPDLLKGKRYGDGKTTPLAVEIKAGNNELETFNLP